MLIRHWKYLRKSFRNNPNCMNSLTMYNKLQCSMLLVTLFSIQLFTLKFGNNYRDTYVLWAYPLCSKTSISK